MDDENLQTTPEPEETTPESTDETLVEADDNQPGSDMEVEPVEDFEEKVEEVMEAKEPSESSDEETEKESVSDAAEAEGLDESVADDTVSEAPTVSGDQKWPGQWYVLHTYSGYEDAVSESLKQRINSLDMQDKIFDVMVPKENQIEIKNGKRKTVEKKMFPGYVLVNMNVTEDSWYVVRNTPNVTGFIGSGTVPVPIAESELKGIFKRMEIEEPKYKIDLSVGDLVNIKDGPFKNYDGSVSEVDDEKGKIKVLVSIFGRETPVELDFLQVKKV